MKGWHLVHAAWRATPAVQTFAVSILRGHHISRTLARILFKLSGFDVPLTCRTKKRTATTVIANAEEKRIDEWLDPVVFAALLGHQDAGWDPE